MRLSTIGRGLGLGLVLSLAFGAFVSAQERSGEIQGTVTDEQGAAVPGATVSAVSSALPKGLQSVSDAQGRYRFLNVPVGTYTLTFTLTGFSTHKQTVEVKLGSQLTANAKMGVGQVTEVIEVTGTALSIDPTSSRSGTNITGDQIDNLAKAGRGFNTLLSMAPGVFLEPKSGTRGVGGVQVAGSSGSENGFYIDGTEVSDLRRGSLRENNNIPLEMVQEIQVKTGGYEAEFGGATGGVVNVATKSGTNSFHGSIGVQYTGDGLNGTDRGFYQRSVANANVAELFEPKEDQYGLLSPVFTIGGPILKDKLHFFTAYSPTHETNTREIEYASGARSFDMTQNSHYSLARLDFTPSSKLQINGSYIWAPSKREGALPARDPRLAAPTNDQSIQGGYTPSQQIAAGFSWTPTSRLVVSGRYGYKYLNDKDGNYGLSQAPYVSYQTSSAAAGSPVPTAGGAGFVNVSSTFGIARDITTRHNGYFDLTYVADLGGQQHTFKAGYAINRVANDVLNDYTNGFFQIYWGDAYSRGSVQNQRGTYGYYIWQDGVKNQGQVNSRNQGFYIQDTWRAGSRLTLNLGVRFENEFLPPYKPEVNGIKVGNPVSFGWGDKIAPRLGAAWDVKGDGRWKASASFGVFYDVLKYELARGSFGSDYWFSHVYRLDDPNVLNLSFANPGGLGSEIITFDNRTLPINAAGELEGIDPNIKPYKGNELSAAIDHQFSSKLIGSVRYTRRRLLRAIEDIGVLDANDSEQYVIGNPGFGLTRNDPLGVYDGKTPNGGFLVPEAVRNYDAVELRGQGQLGNFNFLASYTWSRLNGNYSGGANSDESGRQDPGVSRAFDLPYYYFDESGSQAPSSGPLATDRPHAVKIFAYYTLKGRLGTTNLGVNQVVLSGTPDSTTVIYLSAPTFPFGRGDLGRTPTYSQTDLSLSHSFKLTKGTNLRLEANVRNLFDQSSVISRVTQLNRSGAIPASILPLSAFFAGYNVFDYVNPQNSGLAPGAPYNAIYGLPGASYRAGGGVNVNPQGTAGGYGQSAFAARNANFGAYQDFRTIRLGVTLTF
jgi:outer membrane receptor protein involved in Fe transport